MILTVTMNPSIDTRYTLEKLVLDDVNRATPDKTAGGKGLNVTRVLTQLGDDVLATGLLGGHSGEYMKELMRSDGIASDFVATSGETRTCISIIHEGMQTEILESGPTISAEEYKAFLEKFSELALNADVVTFSGSLPKGIDAGCYAELIAISTSAGSKAILDSSGAALDAALSADTKPSLVKPNLSELNGILGTNFGPEDIAEIKETLAEDPRFQGVEWVVVSMGSAGSVAFVGDRTYRALAPRVEAINCTGCGDSTIAGFAHSFAAKLDPIDTLKTANTCGTLNAMDPKTGHLLIDKWDEIYEAVEVSEL